ncbi:DUF434 domain-containing protein [Spirochaetia bacterium 38H-sp]|uniref:DUF434 domain-containing protein n=1 Tax=Rarispira pelagica TaxID=3141764 RepID=A0ABU9UBK7_9SPIR
MRESIFTQDFLQAAKDYRLFLDMGYPEKAVASLVGNKYRLSREQRMILYRGVLPSYESEKNAKKKISAKDINGKLIIDGYNVLLTIVNYLTGRTVFISTDSFVRDIGGIHGSIKKQDMLDRAEQLLCDFCRQHIQGEIVVFLDKPVSHSAELAVRLDRLFSSYKIHAEAVLVDSADYELKRHEGVVATSDSVVLSSAACAADLAAEILQENFSPWFPDLRECMS